jgi:thymidine phosphorylase
MVALGNACGVKTRALLTPMNAPLGRAAGNWLEVRESVACLEGHGPPDLRELVLACAAHLLLLTGKARSLPAARNAAEACLNSGAPRRKWDEMLAAQGADLNAFQRKLALDHTAPVVRELAAERAGWVSRCDARAIGEIVRDLGGGRFTKDSVINPDVGVDGLAKPGERVARGDRLARIHAADAQTADRARERLRAAFDLAPRKPRPVPLIRSVIG